MRASMSLRSDPSACASDTRAVTRLSNARRRASALALDLGVAAHPQQQGDIRAASRRARARRRAARGRAGRRRGRPRHPVSLEHALERTQCGVERAVEDLVLRREVVVDRGLREAEPVGEHAHRGRVVAVLVERGHGDLEDPLLVVPGASAPFAPLVPFSDIALSLALAAAASAHWLRRS